MAWEPSAKKFPATNWVRYRPKLWEFNKVIEGYSEPLPPRVDDDLYRSVLEDVRRQFQIAKVHPFHENEIIRHYPYPDKLPEEPYISQGFIRNYQINPCGIKQYICNLPYGLYKWCHTPCSPKACTFASKENKFRMFWFYPLDMTHAEYMFAQPLFHSFKHDQASPYGLWIQYSKGHLRTLKSHLQNGQSLWLGLKWKCFDQRVPAWLIRDIFNILWSYIDISQYTVSGTPLHPRLLPKFMDQIVHYFINTPIKLPMGNIFRKKQGIPTGSQFTNMVETLANAIVTQYCLRSLNASYSEGSQWYMGGESLVLLHQAIDIKQFASVAKERFGFELDTNKTELGHNVSFLGYKMSPTGHPIADYDKLLAKLLLPDIPDTSESDFVTRAVALQLSCFGIGCMEFTKQVDQYLAETTAVVTKLHKRDELYLELERLGLEDFPPLKDVMLRVSQPVHSSLIVLIESL